MKSYSEFTKEINMLFVTSEIFNMTGAGSLARAYLSSLRSIVGDEHLFSFVFPKRNIDKENNYDGYVTRFSYTKPQKLLNAIVRKDPSIGRNIENELISYIEKKKISVIFLFRSTQGELLRIIRKYYPSLPVIVLFHDIFPDVMNTRRQEKRSLYYLKSFLYYRYAKAERYCIIYDTIRIVLNNREKKLFKQYYEIEPDYIIPIICDDSFSPEHIEESSSTKLSLLFVGQYFLPNVNGIRWFVKRVLPQLDDNVELVIVGKGMEILSRDSLFQDDRIKVIGTVPSIEEYYYRSDIVIAPILEGTGMKSKIAEALMYGKALLASREALVGYDYLEDALCNDENDYIRKIHYYSQNPPSKYINTNRCLFEKYHSFEKMTKIINEIISSL